MCRMSNHAVKIMAIWKAKKLFLGFFSFDSFDLFFEFCHLFFKSFFVISSPFFIHAGTIAKSENAVIESNRSSEVPRSSCNSRDSSSLPHSSTRVSGPLWPIGLFGSPECADVPLVFCSNSFSVYRHLSV